MALKVAGWTLSIVCGSKHQKEVEAYAVGSPKIMYGGERGPTSCSYLLCLLSAGTGLLAGLTITHFKNDLYYGDLLEGRNPLLREGRRKPKTGR